MSLSLFSKESVAKILSLNLDKGPRKIEVQASKKLKDRGARIRLKNIQNGRSIFIDVATQENLLSSEQIQELLGENSKNVKIEISVLDARRFSGPRALPSLESKVSGQFASSLLLDQPIWLPIEAQLKRSKDTWLIQIDPIIIPQVAKKVIISPELAAQRRKLQEDRVLRRFFEIGWEALKDAKYEISKDAFEKILARQASLNSEQKSQAHLGLGISQFNLSGCQVAMKDLSLADRDPRNRDDVNYYLGLCYVQLEKYVEAEKPLLELNKKQHPVYGENARFYLGIVAEAQNKFDEARTYYLDTIDFSSQESLIEMAKQRLADLDRKEREHNYQFNWFNFALSSALTHDTNVASAPGSTSASELNLSGKSALSSMLVAFAEVNLPLSQKWENRYHYSFVMLHYLKDDVSSTYDMQNHDAGGTFAFTIAERNAVKIDLAYNTTMTGVIGKSDEFLRSYNGTISWAHLVGDLQAPTNSLETSLLYSYAQAVQEVAVASTDPSASTISVTSYYNYLSPVHNWAPGLKIDFSSSEGEENSYYSIALMGRHRMPLSQKFELFFNQDLQLAYKDYFSGALERKDQNISYVLGLSKAWSTWLETRFQVTSSFNLSNVDAYKFNKFQSALLVNALF